MFDLRFRLLSVVQGFSGFSVVVALCLPIVSSPALAQSGMVIYDDALDNTWANWSWGSTINLGSTSFAHGGSKSIAVTLTAGWGALYLEHADFNSSPYASLSFWINGGTAGGQRLQVSGVAGGAQQLSTNLPALAANTWQQVTLPLTALGLANRPDLDGIWIWDRTGSAQPTFYVDDLSLTTNTNPAPGVTNVAIAIDVQANRHAISPGIYGTAFASSNQLADLNFTLNRSGGNAETRYNWQLNAHNHAADWYFESLDDGSSTPGATVDNFVANSKNGGAQPMITIPMIGWMPKLGASRGKLSSYSIAKYGPQTGNDSQWFPDAGNGIASPSDVPITTNDPTDANFLTNSVFQRGYVQHLINRWGSATNGGVRYYFMDNEHSLWFSTHRDVHPVGPTMQEIRDKFFDYAGMVKSNDPNALICAPEEWGWSGYFFSGYDQQNAGNHDRAANGGWDYMPWLLDQIHQHDQGTGRRVLDYFTLHCYPQGNYAGVYEYGDDVSTTAQLLRNRSTRQLWDSNYVDASWIGVQPANNILMLIPRMKDWVATYYPGTKIGITEYNWGAEGFINGATAQADLLGIFGREGLDLATRWTTPATGTPAYNAMKIYRNYDGNKSTFGDVSVAANGPNPDNVSVFAAIRSSDGALTVMVINKQLTAAAALAINIAHFVSNGAAQVWQLTSANLISHLSNVGLAGTTLNETVPAQSITLFVLPAGAVVPPPPPLLLPGGLSPSNTFHFSLTNGVSGQTYVIQSSSDLLTWSSLQTNTLATGSADFNLPAPDSAHFYRALWTP